MSRYYQTTIQYQRLSEISTTILEQLIQEFQLILPEAGTPSYREELIRELIFYAPRELETRLEDIYPGFGNLPPEIYQLILEELSLAERYHLTQLSHRFNSSKTIEVLQNLRSYVKKTLSAPQLNKLLDYLLEYSRSPLFHQTFLDLLNKSRKIISLKNWLLIWRRIKARLDPTIQNLYMDYIIRRILGSGYDLKLNQLVLFLKELEPEERALYLERIHTISLRRRFYNWKFMEDPEAQKILDQLIRILIRRGFELEYRAQLPENLRILILLINNTYYHIMDVTRDKIHEIFDHIEDYLDRDAIIDIISRIPILTNVPNNANMILIRSLLHSALERF